MGRLPLATLTTLALALAAAQSVRAQAPSGQPTAANVAEMKFVMFPGMPTCASGSVQSGDPSKGPSILMAKMNPGCVFPWHWHTPAEHLMKESVLLVHDGPLVGQERNENEPLEDARGEADSAFARRYGARSCCTR